MSSLSQEVFQKLLLDRSSEGGLEFNLLWASTSRKINTHGCPGFLDIGLRSTLTLNGPFRVGTSFVSSSFLIQPASYLFNRLKVSNWQ